MSECGYQYTAMPTIKPSTRGKNDEIRNNKDRKRKEKMQLTERACIGLRCSDVQGIMKSHDVRDEWTLYGVSRVTPYPTVFDVGSMM